MTQPQSVPPAASSPPLDLSDKLPKLVPRKRAPQPANRPPPYLEKHEYLRPSRRILSPEDHQLFLKSETCTLVEAFIYGIADSVRDRSVSSIKDAEVTDTVKATVQILGEAEKVLERCPPEDTGSRFGNPVFRTFLDEVESALPTWHTTLGLTDQAQVDEISTYLHNSFGNKRRIDYGSGHELNFFLWLLCLNRLGLLPRTAFPALALVVLPAYLRLMRKIQESYYLEPAGSHGVWGLDDYQFLPFLFGAAQLLHHPYITPKSIHNALVLEEEGKEYLYLDQIAFVNSVKNVEGLRWHSPMLDDISAAKNWGKIEGGMRKMFRKEILEKLPVMQHFLFGSLIPAVEGMSTEEEAGVEHEEEESEGGEVKVFDDEAGKRHVHASAGWGIAVGYECQLRLGRRAKRGKGCEAIKEGAV
ncbi:Serine/threonine-protein phosphatase 2A activator 2 [Neocucurbitaria cava]|uniref:Serine/threonine-protein phosphatase 2A activator n=1 Tax=Neocucurbitaria cava TaxID=798079 RepID=A0A9W8YHU0_9PLEO|nr:Serine/threonine-protein phosphatase 2A activator 2 [Neocucurbitaria cava]